MEKPAKKNQQDFQMVHKRKLKIINIRGKSRKLEAHKNCGEISRVDDGDEPTDHKTRIMLDFFSATTPFSMPTSQRVYKRIKCPFILAVINNVLYYRVDVELC